jgi:hypothetical protein
LLLLSPAEIPLRRERELAFPAITAAVHNIKRSTLGGAPES